MTAVKERVPKAIHDPLALVSITLMIVGLTVGYIFVMVGINVYLELILPEALSTTDGIVVTATGVACLAAGYLGWRGFMIFSY